MTRRIDRFEIGGRGDDFRISWVIRAMNKLAKIRSGCIRMIQKVDRGRHHLAQIMWWNIGRHSHSNARGPIEQNARDSR